MDFKDKLLLGLAVICAIIIFVVFAANKANSDYNQFLTGSYYTPRTTTKVGAKEGNSWSNFAGGNRLECPGVDNTTPVGTRVSMNGATKYNMLQYFPISMEVLGISNNVVTANSAQSVLQLIDEVGTTMGGCTSLNVAPSSGDYIEIIAPFGYTFDCSNIDEERTTISIVSSNRQLKLVFDDVVNWFCAGPYGTQSVYMNAGEDIVCPWEEHGDHHSTIIGHSKNADISGGSAGDLIGYATDSTKMTLYVVENGTWVAKSWFGILKNK